MLDIIVFAVVLALVIVVAQFVGALLMMKFFMSEKFIKKYSKMSMSVTKELMEEMEDYFA